MAPTRKSRSVNKQFLDYTEASQDKDVGNSNKSQQRKRKLSGMLGSQWSKEELERFYGAYRKYGKDWRKVAGALRSRSVEMVEALYNMNKAYLSLPEGTASVAGLIAMVTDLYNVLERSDYDRESNDASRFSRKPQKRQRGKVQLSHYNEDFFQSQLVASRDGCLSFLKKNRSDGCAVGKRTPRFPVSYSFNKFDGENYAPINEKGQRSVMDDEATHVAALTLTEASCGGPSSQISYLPFKNRMNSQFEMARAKLLGTAMNEDLLESSLDSRRAEKEDYARDTSALLDMEGVGTVRVNQKGKKMYKNKQKINDARISQFDDCCEASSGTEDVKRTIKIEVTDTQIRRAFSRGKRKRNKKLFSGDEISALDGLQVLADLSLMMPAEFGLESSVPLNVEKPTVDLANRSSAVESVSISHERNQTEMFDVRVEASISGKSKLERDCTINFNALSEGEKQIQSSNTVWKHKHKSPSFKAFVDEEKKSMIKGKSTGQIFALQKQWESFKPAECSSNSDKKIAGLDSDTSIVQAPYTSQVNLPTKQKRRRKMDPKRMSIPNEMKSSDIISKDWCDKCSSSFQDGDKLSCCLSSYMVRRWCTFEWFYSAIDYPWFAKREFVEYLNHVGLGNIPRLTHVEWGVIRSSLGKPRRFSEHFLSEEKEKLKQYRASVRKHYTDLRAGIGEGLPTDLARPLSVGQRVIALHPKLREVHDGSVLTVDHDKCRIQFDLSELGVEFVMDIDCMPLNPLENMPEALRRQNTECSLNSRGPKARPSDICGPIVFSPSEHMENLCTPIHNSMQQAILMELGLANENVLKKQNGGGSSQEDSKLYKTHYTTVSSGLLNLRQHNTHTGNSISHWQKSPAIPNGLGGPPSSIDHFSISCQDSGFNIVKIGNGSRSKAHTMVHAAIQAISSMKEGEDAFMRIGEALDCMNSQKLSSDPLSAVMKTPEKVSSGMVHQRQESSFTSEPPLKHYFSGPKSHKNSNRSEAEIPAELITSCVATLLMVQICTERQYPPADVAQMLDSAVTSLHPCCPQNLPIYRGIQMCMGRIKTQILAKMPI